MFEFKLPDIGEGVSEGEIVAWSVKPGDRVREDDAMVEVMTDKATVTIGAPKTGTIRELRVAVGQVAKVGQVLVVIDTAAAAEPAAAKGGGATAGIAASAPAVAAGSHGAAAASKEPAATAVGDIKETLPGAGYFRSKPAVSAGTNGSHGSNGNGVNAHGHVPARAEIAEYFAAKPLATPATRKLARDLGVDLRRIPPSGGAGRVTKDDVRSFARGAATGDSVAGASHGGAMAITVASSGATHAIAPAPVAAPGPEAATITPTPVAGRAAIAISSPSLDGSPLEERRPFVGIRRKIAERMQTSKNTAAHFTFVEECDASALMALRDRLRPAAEAAGVKLSFLPFITKAVVAALKRHPILNSALDETTNELVLRRYYHVGIAAATDAGLMVPVVRDADRRSILDIAREIDRLGDGARNGTLKPAELQGSTFTITSLGKQGGLFATPILNFPEVGILGVHQMKEKPVVRGGQIVVGHVMLLSLSFDHRIVDGHVGAAFAYEVLALLTDPDRLLLEA